MADDEKSTGQVLSDSASTVAKHVNHARKSAVKLAKIAKDSKGNWVAAAASAAKEAIKDPEWASKAILHIVIFSVIPIFLVICMMFNFGGTIIAYVENIIRGAMEEAAVDTGGSLEGFGVRAGWNLMKTFLGGDTKNISKAVTDKIAEKYSDEFYAGHTDEKGTNISDGVDGASLDKEFQMAVNPDAAKDVFMNRLAMVRKSAESRYDQYMDSANELAGAIIQWGNVFLMNQLEQKIKSYIKTSKYEMLEPQIDIPDNELTDIQCAAALALFSAQTNQEISNVKIMDLRYWLGMYSRLESIFVKEKIAPSDDPILNMEQIPVEIGNKTETIVPANIENLQMARLNVERWHGTFVPQYVLEQYRQDENADRILAEDSTASQEEKDAAAESKMGTSTAEYPDSVGLIDEFMKFSGVSCDLIITTDIQNDISYVKPLITINVGAKSPYELGTDVAGLWSGSLDNTDASGKNRSYNNSAYPDLLSKTWTDNRGASYERQEPYQYEYYLDMLKGYSDEYDLAGAEEYFGETEFFSGDGNDIVAEANRIYNAYHEQTSSTQRNYVWSEYYHTPTRSELAWCCAFVYVCADHCGYIGKDNVFGPHMYAWCAYSRDFFAAQGRTTRDPNYKPKPGDVIYFYNEGSTGIAHVGLVEYYDEETGKVHTIEGNCGDKLAKKSYNAAPDTFLYWTTVDGKDKRRLIWGYASPNYPVQDPAPTGPSLPTPEDAAE